jgi:hypothetical protein
VVVVCQSGHLLVVSDGLALTLFLNLQGSSSESYLLPELSAGLPAGIPAVTRLEPPLTAEMRRGG